MKAIEIKNLEKKYGTFQALKHVDLVVEEGDFFALLWENGAGKTTIIGILIDLVKKTSGKVKIFWVDIDKDFPKAKNFIGVVPQEFNLDIFSKAFDVLTINAWYHGIPMDEAIPRAEELLKKLSLWEKKDNQVRELSGGMKRRLMIARALMHKPKLLILDEPTAWVDLNLRKSTRSFLQELNQAWTTIVLTTHYLEEVEMLCNTLAFINKWQIVEQTSKKNFFKKITENRFELTLSTPIKVLPKCLEKYKWELKWDDKLIAYIDKKENLSDFFEVIKWENLEISDLKNTTNELEELFQKFTS